MKVKKVSSKALIEAVKSLYSSIYVSECFATGDFTRYLQIRQELERRGYTVDEVRTILVRKEV